MRKCFVLTVQDWLLQVSCTQFDNDRGVNEVTDEYKVFEAVRLVTAPLAEQAFIVTALNLMTNYLTVLVIVYGREEHLQKHIQTRDWTGMIHKLHHLRPYCININY